MADAFFFKGEFEFNKIHVSGLSKAVALLKREEIRLCVWWGGGGGEKLWFEVISNSRFAFGVYFFLKQVYAKEKTKTYKLKGKARLKYTAS